MRHKLGDRVSHPVYGTGSIYRVGQNGKLLVSFVGLPFAPHDRFIWLSDRTVLKVEDSIEQLVKEEIRSQVNNQRTKIVGFAWLSPHDLFIPSHQRATLDQTVIDKIVKAGWNQRLSPSFMIAYRDERNNVYIGRHRTMALLKLMEIGKLPQDFTVPCIIEPMTEEEELEARADEGERTQYQPEIFGKRAVVPGRVENHIFVLGQHYSFYPEKFITQEKVSNANRYSCYKALRNIYLGKTMDGEFYTGVLNSSDGSRVLHLIMFMHRKAWGTQRFRILEQTTVNALKLIIESFGVANPPSLSFSNTGRLDCHRLLEIMQQMTSRAWTTEVEKTKNTGDNNSWVLARLLLDGKDYSPSSNVKSWYNRGLRQSSRLKL